jgi:hypothetical protein
VRTASTSAAVSPWAIARARAVSGAALGRGMADCSSHVRTAVVVVSHVRPTWRPGRSPRCRRAYTVSAETVSDGAVRWTSRTSGPRPAAGAVGRGEGREGGGRASSRCGTGGHAVEEQSRKGRPLLQQTPLFLIITPNIPEVWTGTAAHHRPHGGPPPHGQRLPAGALIRKSRFVDQ